MKSKKKEEDIELDSSRFNSIDRRSLDRNQRRTHHLVNPTPVVNKINVGVQKYPERIIPANPSAPGVVDYPKKQRSSSSHFFTIPESTIFFQAIFFYLVQLIEHPILRIPNFNFANLRCSKVFVFSF